MAAFDTPAAVEAYRAGLAQSPDDADLLWRASLALSARAVETPELRGDEDLLEEAVRLARQAARARPDLARAHAALAIALGRYGRHLAYVHRIRRAREVITVGREAHAAARRAIALDPGDYAPHVVLGVWHRELATVHPVARAVARLFLGGFPAVSLEESEAHLRTAVRLAPAEVTPLFELARTYAAMDRPAAARQAAAAAVAAVPRNALDRIEQREARALLEERR